jgi:hypothetical protein
MPARSMRSPLKVSLMAFGLTAVIGMIVGFVLMYFVIHPGENMRARGEKFGQGLGQLSVCVGVVAYIVQWRRTNKKN